MVYKKHMVYLLLLYTNVCATKQHMLTKENKTMNTHKTWISKTNTSFKPSGAIQTTDTDNNSLTIEWHTAQGPDLTNTVKSLYHILAPTYAKQELEFVQAHPETVSTEHFLQPLSHLFENGPENVNWNTVQTELETTFNQFFQTTDFATFSSDEEVNIFVIAKKTQTSEVIGCIQFLIAPEYETGTIKAALFGLIPSAQHKGIEQLLMSSIFTIIPNTQRLFLHTRISNKDAINLYKHWGFTQFEGPLPYWIDLEYNANKHEKLQNRASQFN